MTRSSGNDLQNAIKGLTRLQRAVVVMRLEEEAPRDKVHGGRTAGWSVYREPSTINPPTTVRLLHRNGMGKVTKTISVTENGLTKVAEQL